MSLLLECLLNDEFGSVKLPDASLERLDSKRPTVFLKLVLVRPQASSMKMENYASKQ